jgi:hypothetical protein
MNGHALERMSPAAVDRVRAFEVENLARAQVPIATHHLIHAGMYARTIMIPAGVGLTGALIKRATTLILAGDALAYGGAGVVDEAQHFRGYHVIPARAFRKTAFLAYEDTYLTMIFPTTARTVEEAEREFTDEADLLFSRRGENVINITED